MTGHLDQRLIIVSGKGGVGKTAVSAAIALGSARRGMKTLVCEINTQERVSQFLGHPPAGPSVRELEKNLWAVDVRPADALKEYALMTVKFERVYKVVFENKFVRYFLRFLPSLQELVMLGKVLFHLKEKDDAGAWRFDRVVLDAPATGHAIAFLSVPQVLLDTVPPGALASDATWMRDFLVDPKTTGAVLVSLPEEMPVNETLDLARALRERVHVALAAVVLNAFIPARFTDEELGALGPHPALAGRAQAYRGRHQRSVEAEARLQSLGAPVVKVPRLFVPEFNRASLERLVEELQPLLGPSK